MQDNQFRYQLTFNPFPIADVFGTRSTIGETAK